MTPTIILGLMAAVPALLIVLLRSDAAVVLLSLCAGDVLVKFVGSDASDLVSRTASGASGWAYAGLLVLPAVLSVVALRKSVSSAKTPFNILAAVAAGVVFVLLVTPLLPGGIQHDLMDNFVWDKLQRYEAGIISVSIAIALVALWVGGHHGKHGHRKRH